jgi:hypothetical protein
MGTEGERPLYSAESANAALPEIRDRLFRLRDSFAELAGHHEHVRTLAPGNGADRKPGAGVEAARAVADELSWFNEAGIVVQDIEQGLIDFPGEREGREIHLCWKLDEDSVAFWHEPGAGFAARKPLNPGTA